MTWRGQHGDLSLLKRLIGEAHEYWGHLTLVLLLSFLSVPLALLTPIPLKIAVDHVVDHQPLSGLFAVLLLTGIAESSLAILCFAAALLLLITLLQNLEAYGSWLLQLYTGEKLVLSLRTRLFGHIQRLSLSYHDKRGTSDSLYRVQYDVPAMQYLSIHFFVPFVTSGLTLCAMVWVIARLDWQLAIITLLVLPLLVLFSELYRNRARFVWAEFKDRDSGAMSVIQEVLGAMRVVKAFGQESSEQDRFYQRSSQSLRTQLRAISLEAKFGTLIAMTISVGAAAALIVGVRHVQASILSLGDLFVVMSYLTQLCKILEALTKKVGTLQGSLASADRVFAVFDEFPDVPESKGARAVPSAAAAIDFSEVDFQYGADRPVLHGITFHVEAGIHVAISGPTGAGKTTLVSLLPRFYDPTAGRVLIGGVDLREFKLEDLRRQFAMVLQEPLLFSTTVAENIAYGRPGSTDEQIVAAAKDANAHEFINRLPKGYSTLVGERGMGLSGGERQRVSIARAFLRDAPILILDEPTSAVDADSETMIVEAITRLMRNRTTFTIAHRPTTLQNCELHLHLEHGRLVKIVRQNELLAELSR
jgi:ATP-binding cassette subfamily B protein